MGRGGQGEVRKAGEDCRLAKVCIILLLGQTLIVLSFTQESERRIPHTSTLSLCTLSSASHTYKAGSTAHQYTSPVVCLSHSLPHHHFVYDYTFKSNQY